MDRIEYYAYLATTVPAGELARAAARKVAQRATLALRKKAPLEPSELLNAFCAEDARDLALKLSAPRASMLWADAGRRDEVLSVAAQVPGLVGRILARADRAWAREFDVFGRKVRFGRGVCNIDWHLDPLSGKRFDPAMDALAIGFGNDGLDPKGPWAIARFEQGLALGQGVWISPSEEDRARYAHEFTTQVLHFARENPVWVGVNWSCAMEVALRAANLSLSYLMMRHRPELQSPEFAVTFASLLSAHGRYIEEHLEHTGAVSNNHYVADLVGLMHLGVIFPELPGARGWRERATRGLQEEIRKQVYDDGFSFEGSTSYHRLATELFTMALFIAHAGRIRLGEDYEQRLHEMYRAVRAYLTPGMLAPQIGDNDSGRALPLCDRASLDHAYLLPLGAALFLDPELKPEGMDYCDEALFLMGPAGLERYRSLAESSGPARSAALARAGLYFVRSADLYCAISCGPNGQGGLGGHSHNDKLGIELHQGGRPVIVDTGTYCYSSDPVQRNAFRATAAHSTVQIDGLEQNRLPETRLFALPDDARARMLTFESNPARERFVGEHRGYDRLVPPVRHRREVSLERGPRALLVLDRITGVGAHEAIARYQLPDREARIRAATAEERERLARIPGHRAFNLERVVELGPEGAPVATLAIATANTLQLTPSWYSPGYGERRESLCIEVTARGEVPVECCVAILMHRNGGDA